MSQVESICIYIAWIHNKSSNTFSKRLASVLRKNLFVLNRFQFLNTVLVFD